MHTDVATSLSDLSTREQKDMGDSSDPRSGSPSPPGVEILDDEKTGNDETTKAPGIEPVTGLRLVLLLASLTIACFLVLLDTTIVSTAVPRITDHFHSLSDVGWYASSYQLTSAVLQPLTGKIYHHFSLKWSFVAFFAVFELGSVICGAAQSSAMLIVGRAVAGMGGSGLINGALTILSAAVTLEKRPPLTGMLMGFIQLGSVLGPVLGGAFTSRVTWRWCFYINLPPAAVVMIPLVLMRVPDEVAKEPALDVLRHLHRHLDLVGFALFGPAVIQLLLALQFGGNQYAWDSSRVIGLFCGAGVTFAVWLAWNVREGDAALLPARIIRRRPVWASGLNYTGLTSTLQGASYFLPIYFQAVKGVDPILSGVYLLPSVLPQLVGAVLFGVLVTRIGRVPPISIFGATLTSVGSGLYALFRPGTPTGQWVGFQVMTGFGRGAAFQMPIVAAQNATSPSELSPTMAFIIWCQYMGPTVILTLCNTIFDATLKSQLRRHAPAADVAAVVAAGATGFRSVVAAADLPGVLLAYSNSLDRVFYLVAACGVVAWFAAWGMGWKDIRKPQSPPTAAADDSAATDQIEEDGDKANPAGADDKV